jgi:hypothetical protein
MIKKIGLILFWTVSTFWLSIIFPTFLLSILSALFIAIKSRTYGKHFKTTDLFSYHMSQGKTSIAYSYYASFAAAIVVLVHSLFAYFYYDYGFYPVKDGGDLLVDVFCGMLWISGTSTLVVIVGRNFGEMLTNSGIDKIFSKRIMSYVKLTLMIVPINVSLWYLLTLWRPELDNNTGVLPHLFLRFHHLWFFIYTIIYYFIAYIGVKFFNWRILRSAIAPVKKMFQKFPNLSMFLISLSFLAISKFGSIVGNPESVNTIEPGVFGYFFLVFLFGVFTCSTKNYIVSYRKIFAYILSAILLFLFLYSAVTVNGVDQGARFFFIALATSALIVCQQNLSLSMCCQFFSKKNPGIEFIKRATGLIFCFNLPLVVVFHYLLKGINIPILAKIIIINYGVWVFFIAARCLFDLCLKKRVKNS